MAFPCLLPTSERGRGVRFPPSTQQIHERLRVWVRVSQNREPSPSEAIMDSQVVETATMISKQFGYDSGKKTKRRKHNLLVDTRDLPLQFPTLLKA